jgi:hypothetical protein
MLFLAVIAYTVVSCLFFRRSQSYANTAHMTLVSDVQRRVAFTTLFVFAAVVLRTVHETLFLLAPGDFAPAFLCHFDVISDFKLTFCSSSPCDACHFLSGRSSSLPDHIWRWYIFPTDIHILGFPITLCRYTPLFRSLIIFFCSPLASMVALWGMGGSRHRQQQQMQPSTSTVIVDPLNSEDPSKSISPAKGIGS